MRRRFSAPFLIMLHLLHLSTPSSSSCPYDIPFAARIIPRECYANATLPALAPAPSPSSPSSSSSTPYTSTTSCCWFVFAAYLYAAIRHANATGAAFLPDPTASNCTSSFTSYLIREGLSPPSLLLSGDRCNLAGDPVKFVAGSRPCQYPTVSAVRSESNLSDAQHACSGGPVNQLTTNQPACTRCQNAVIKAVFALLDATKSKEFVACGMAATMGIWSPSLPEPQRFRSYALCMVQVLENVGSLGTANLFPSPPTISNGSEPTSPFDSSGSSAKLIAAGSASAGALLCLISVLCIFLAIRRRRRRKWKRSAHAASRDHEEEDHTADIGSPLPTEGLYIFTRSELKQATNRYDPSLLLGEGGAGKVYLGRLPSGQHVAIKRISKPRKVREFYREVVVLAKLRHRNLTTLLGYCLEKKEHLLVYEYMPGGNLSKALYHGNLSWHRRVQIAVDVAEGLVYLHEFPEGAVVHRDVKPTNVLLTETGQAKLADFGVSRIMPTEDTHVSTEVKGTRGYVDPEYFSAGQVSEAADVYSFGVVLLELVTGLKAVVPTPSGGAESIVQTAHTVMAAVGEGGGEEPDVGGVVDSRLGVEWDRATVGEVFSLAYRCVKPYKYERPRMKEVLAVLKRALAYLDARMDGSRGEAERIGEDADVEGSPASGAAGSEGACSPPFTSPSVRGLSL